jgi:hypothetical protein
MARFFHWHGRPGRWHGGWHHRWHRPEGWGDEPPPDVPPPPSPPSLFGLPLPPLPFNLETGEGEDEYGRGDEEGEMHRRRRWARYQSAGQSGGENEFASENTDTDAPRRTGRWVRHRDRIILRDL